MITGKVAIVVNPMAGGRQADGVGEWLVSRLHAVGAPVAAVRTNGRGHAVALASQAALDGVETLVVVGGDGTLSEVVDGLLSVDVPGELPRLALVPCGSGNDLARGLGIGAWNGDPIALERGRTLRLDAGRASYVALDGTPATRHFLNVADLGLGGRAVTEAARHRAALGSMGAFLWGALVSIWNVQNPHVSIEVDGTLLLEGPVPFVVVANGRRFASGMRVAPQADPADGLLDVLALRATPRWQLALELLPRVYLGAHLGHPRVVLARGKRVIVHSEARLPLEMDGELVGTGDAELSVLPGAIRVVVPAPGGSSPGVG